MFRVSPSQTVHIVLSKCSAVSPLTSSSVPRLPPESFVFPIGATVAFLKIHSTSSRSKTLHALNLKLHHVAKARVFVCNSRFRCNLQTLHMADFAVRRATVALPWRLANCVLSHKIHQNLISFLFKNPETLVQAFNKV